MTVTHLSTPTSRIDVSLDGVTFTRSRSDAARRAASRRALLPWEDVTGASVDTTRKGHAVVRVQVAGATPVERHREDPHAIKVPRHQAHAALELVDRINDEVAGRLRWKRAAAETSPG